ncbi:hypothetical protein [Flammeovirga sp. OC4]|uniref:hypothetical protein n=1 Tax=Flammeovirga sp. OC4 TaxID=1382345 RepID=UPI000693F1B0|nr:hypothetical protein [Flammeovirga sp. OC4]
MRSNNNRSNYSTPKKLTENKDNWEKIAKGELPKSEINENVYKGKYTRQGKTYYSVRDPLSKMYYNKCCYCETIEHAPEVEHYRPKKEVTEEKTHNGYFWLCYEWTNLLPSCRYCNTSGGKGMKFPLAEGGVRVFDAPIEEGVFNTDRCKVDTEELLAEKPLLLHPEVEKVEDYFTFENNGAIKGIDGEGRGEATISICNMNRDNLLERRQNVIDKWLEDIEDILLDYSEGEATLAEVKRRVNRKLQRLKGSCDVKEEFSLLQMVCLSDFERLILNQLENETFKVFLKGIYDDFLVTEN